MENQKAIKKKESFKGFYHYMKQAWKKPDKKMLHERMIEWRSGANIVKVEKPLRLDRARNLGYKAKKGFVVVRVIVLRGGHKRPKPNKARKSTKQSNKKILKMNYQWIAEQLGLEPPRIEVGQLGVSINRKSNKRCSNQRILESGFVFRYPGYREGYAELLRQESD